MNLCREGPGEPVHTPMLDTEKSINICCAGPIIFRHPVVHYLEMKLRNYRLRMNSSLRLLRRGLNAFYWHQIFALDAVVVEAQKMISSHAGLLTYTVYHHRETI